MKRIFIVLGISLLLVGCDERVIKMKTGTAYNVQCEGVERTTVLDPVVTIGKNVIIRYKNPTGEGLIIAKKCKIE